MDWIFVLDYVLDFLCSCWLAAFVFSLSFHLISCHFISFPFISAPMSCHVPLRHEIDQYLNVDQWQKICEKSSKKSKKEENEEQSKENSKSMSA